MPKTDSFSSWSTNVFSEMKMRHRFVRYTVLYAYPPTLKTLLKGGWPDLENNSTCRVVQNTSSWRSKLHLISYSFQCNSTVSYKLPTIYSTWPPIPWDAQDKQKWRWISGVWIVPTCAANGVNVEWMDSEIERRLDLGGHSFSAGHCFAQWPTLRRKRCSTLIWTNAKWIKRRRRQTTTKTLFNYLTVLATQVPFISPHIRSCC